MLHLIDFHYLVWQWNQHLCLEIWHWQPPTLVSAIWVFCIYLKQAQRTKHFDIIWTKSNLGEFYHKWNGWILINKWKRAFFYLKISWLLLYKTLDFLLQKNCVWSFWSRSNVYEQAILQEFYFWVISLSAAFEFRTYSFIIQTNESA